MLSLATDDESDVDEHVRGGSDSNEMNVRESEQLGLRKEGKRLRFISTLFEQF